MLCPVAPSPESRCSGGPCNAPPLPFRAGVANPVGDGSRLPVLSGQARGGTMSFADIGSIVVGVIVLGIIGYFMYTKVVKH